MADLPEKERRACVWAPTGDCSNPFASFIVCTICVVGKIMEKHGAVAWSDYQSRTPELMLKDLNELWDRFKKLEKTADEKDQKILSLERQVGRLRLARNILSGLIVASLVSSFVSVLKVFLGLPH